MSVEHKGRYSYDPLVKQITDFRMLQNHVLNSELGFKDAIVECYAVLGEQLGFEVKNPFELSLDGAIIGSLDLVWLDGDELLSAFEVEFGSREEMLAALTKLLLSNAELAVLFSSSRVRTFTFGEIRNIAKAMVAAATVNALLLVDVSRECYEYIDFTKV